VTQSTYLSFGTLDGSQYGVYHKMLSWPASLGEQGHRLRLVANCYRAKACQVPTFCESGKPKSKSTISLWCLMTRSACLLLLGLTSRGLFPSNHEPAGVVFRSDVSLVRVDVQVVDHNNRSITGLNADDFVLREQGHPMQICNFAWEDMPVDLLFLFDVSGSMQPHVKRVASAAHEALRGLGDNDRVAIMVFERTMRLRMPFRNSRQDIDLELDNMIRQEPFHGGTDITRALVVAASYLEVQARHGARRAIVILTDDQTDCGREDAIVSGALGKANVVLSALIVPDQMANRTASQGRLGGPRDGIILGTQPAGTSEIARQSGGDSLPADDASALSTTLAHLRQRYALHFHSPPDAKSGEVRSIDVQLVEAVRRRYPDAELCFRRTYVSSNRSTDSGDGTPPFSAVPQSPTDSVAQPQH
jgi:VWFA-related protein